MFLIVASLAIGHSSALGEELATNGGFESGLNGWGAIDAQLSITSQAHSGSTAAKLTGDTAFDAEAFQWTPVVPLQVYNFSGWFLASGPQIERAHLRLRWVDSQGALLGFQDSPWLTGSSDAYRFVETGIQLAPPDAAQARMSVYVKSFGPPFSILMDDLSFEGPKPSATPTASQIPPPTHTPSVTNGPPTPAPTPQNSSSPPTNPPTASPTNTPKPTPTKTPTPTPKPTPSPVPLPSATPSVFTDLINGGFEQTGSDAVPSGWRKIGGTLASVNSPVRSGSRALALQSQTTSTKWAYQAVTVQGGLYYQASVYASFTGSAVDSAFLRVSWYASADGSGEAISSSDSHLLDSPLAVYRQISTDAVQAPGAARSARIRLMLRPTSATAAVAYFDDASFAETEEPVAVPTATPTPAASLAQTPFHTGTTKPTTTPKPAQTASPTPQPEPSIFSALTNGSFEEAREDGSPFAWAKVGGEITVDDLVIAHGALSLRMYSQSSSTKWAYQTIVVQPSRPYEFAGFAASDSGVQLAFLRVSWYATNDGSGEAIASVDSVSGVAGHSFGFHWLSTGSVQSPAEAHSAKLRLMLRPDGAAVAIAHFDGMIFGDPDDPSDGAPVGNSEGAQRPGGGREAEFDSQPHSAANSTRVQGAAATPVGLANVEPKDADAAAAEDSGDSTRTALLVLSFALPAAGLAALGGFEVSRRKAGRRPPE
ncbi:MAG: hypothetical protein WD472_11875 [Dehalococcoidia bacterium]